GHTVYLASRTDDKGKEAQENLRKEDGLTVKYVQLDVTNDESISRALDTISKAERRLDVLVNNAGITFSYTKASEISVTAIQN
ncbi:hypothetical protein MPER_00183, partial [Moniliophthora perniciosa FA553]